MMPSLGVKRPRGEGALPELPDEDFPNVYLSKEQIEALGLSMDDIGSEMTLKARVKIDSFSVDERADSEGSRHASLAVLEGDLERATSDEEKAELLFGGSE